MVFQSSYYVFTIKSGIIHILRMRTRLKFGSLFRLPPVSGGASSGFGTTQTHSGTSAESLLGLPHPALSPSFLSPSGGSIRHQDYLNAAAQRLSEMQASAALDPINAIEGKS